MSKNLVIVESPAKAKTIEKFLGQDFKVVSSYGHISDLPSKELGVDVENNFKPKYIISKEKKEVVKALKKSVGKSETIWLASDEDREGEAIAWHLFESLSLEKNKTKRIVFREITKKAILNAIDNPREINYNLVNAQQARRVIDRLVGFEISPILWRKVKGGLSAGRVQSVAVRILVDRENEINEFKAQSSFKIKAEFKSEKEGLVQTVLSEPLELKSDVENFFQLCAKSNFKVAKIEKKPFKKSPSPPFTTSTLQQEASRKLGFSVGRTMSAAQKLYEAGHITYMRTDSVSLSNEAIDSIKEVIKNSYGENYSQVRRYSNKNKGAQEAHEAIRPTKAQNREVSLEIDAMKLYKLIWKRTVSSQMSDARVERTTIAIQSDQFTSQFKAKGEVIVFDGFLSVYIAGSDKIEDDDSLEILPQISVGEELKYKFVKATERFSRPPSRYTEAALVKKMEELGIGRPSTYAPTITTIQNRKYVEKGTYEGHERFFTEISLDNDQISTKKLTENTASEKGKLVPTEVGTIVTDFLVNNFSNILDYNFTASVEKDFDSIANGNQDWTNILNDFYGAFHPNVLDVKENAARETGERLLGLHPENGRKVIVRLGKFGPMAQIGSPDDNEKPLYAGLLPNQKIGKITLEECLELFKLPFYVGDFENEKVETNIGRFGPYIRHNNNFVSLPKGLNPLDVSIEMAIELINEKRKVDAPIANYEGFDVTKGRGRFGPFIKWNGLFINVSKSYDFDNLNQSQIEELIESKKKKEAEKVLKVWEDEGIRIEKARWGRFNVIKGSKKIELPKETDVKKLTLDKVSSLFTKKKTKKV
ncbi:MAG: DNA topoisomerase I [Flavobacteriaceae bacterium]|nr:DNA topoisomerase I [Flavobacteriaceae bacterium]